MSCSDALRERAGGACSSSLTCALTTAIVSFLTSPISIVSWGGQLKPSQWAYTPAFPIGFSSRAARVEKQMQGVYVSGTWFYQSPRLIFIKHIQRPLKVRWYGSVDRVVLADLDHWSQADLAFSFPFSPRATTGSSDAHEL